MAEVVLILHHDLNCLHHTTGSDWRPESNTAVMEEVRAVAQALEDLQIPYETISITAISDLADILKNHSAEVVVNLVEDLAGCNLDACYVPKVCQDHGKGCTGGDLSNLTLTQNKWHTKLTLREAGLPCPEGVLIPKGSALKPNHIIPPPYIVKPACADASEGIDERSTVWDAGETLNTQIEKIHEEFGQPALVEQYIEGREVNVSLRQVASSVEVMPLAEIDFSAFAEGQPRIVDYSAKWLAESFSYRNTPRKIPALLPEALAETIRHQALRCWYLLGCRDYARVDFRLDRADRPYVLEVNANPDISPDAGFAAALEAGNIPYCDFIRDILKHAGLRRSSQSFLGCHIKDDQAGIRRAGLDDRATVIAMLQAANVFRAEEIVMAEEVFDDALCAGERGHYQSFVLTWEGNAIGWICFGAIPGTLSSHDIYWLVIHPHFMRRGFGSTLISFATDQIRMRGGCQVFVETSNNPLYKTARKFYERHGFAIAGQIPNFYGPEDDKLIYALSLGHASGAAQGIS